MAEKKIKIDTSTIKQIMETILELTIQRFKIDSHFDKDEYGIHAKGENVLLETPWFMVSATPQPNPPRFVLMFSTKANSLIAAETVKTIAFVLSPTEYVIGDEYFYDGKNNIVYGEDAKDAHEDQIMEHFGKTRCPCCETFHFINNTDENGMCEACSSIFTEEKHWM